MKSHNSCVIIVTYNGIEWIEKCLNSISQSVIGADVLVVDNGSTDGTLEFLRQNPKVSFLYESKENLGFGRANNFALRHGFQLGYEYYLLLNQDAWIEKDVIGGLIEFLKSNPNFGILSPFHLNGKGDKPDRFFQSYLNRTSDYGEDLKAGNSIKELYETPFVNAACWMIKKETLEKVGIFHPLFDHYGEDDNYIDRLHYEGFRLGITTNLKIYHDRETDGINPIKDDPFRLFKRTLLQTLLKPGTNLSKLDGFWVANNLSKKFSKRVTPFSSRIVFRLRCMSVFFSIFREVVTFKKNREFELRVS